MSDYLPDVSTLYIIAMTVAVLAGSLGIGMLMGAMIRKGSGDNQGRGLLAPFGDFARWLGKHPVQIISFAIGWMLYDWWKS